MRLLINHGGRLSAADAKMTLDGEGHDGQLSRIAYMVTLESIALRQLSLAIPSWVGAMSTIDGHGHC